MHFWKIDKCLSNNYSSKSLIVNTVFRILFTYNPPKIFGIVFFRTSFIWWKFRFTIWAYQELLSVSNKSNKSTNILLATTKIWNKCDKMKSNLNKKHPSSKKLAANSETKYSSNCKLNLFKNTTNKEKSMNRTQYIIASFKCDTVVKKLRALLLCFAIFI